MYGHAFDAFKVMVQDPEAVLAKLVEVGNNSCPLPIILCQIICPVCLNCSVDSGSARAAPLAPTLACGTARGAAARCLHSSDAAGQRRSPHCWLCALHEVSKSAHVKPYTPSEVSFDAWPSCPLQLNDGEPLEVLTDEVLDAIMKNIRRRMTPQPVKIRADVELTCFSYDGILHIQVGLCRETYVQLCSTGRALLLQSLVALSWVVGCCMSWTGEVSE